MGKKVLVLLSHPRDNSFCAAAAQRYIEAATAAGHETRLLWIDKLDFDPMLHEQHPAAQGLEPDLRGAQAAISWADHLALVYPIWWGGTPALLKGFLDRTFLSGFAYRFRPGASFPEPLLKGRTAHLLVTMDTPPWYFRWVYRNPGIHQMQKTTLGFCGIRTTRIAPFGPMIHSKPGQRDAWLRRAGALASSL